MDGYDFDSLTVGERFANGGITVTETHLVMACSVFGDSSPLHLSRSFAMKAGYRDRIVPGIMTAALTLGPISRIAGQWGVTHFGDEIEYLAPVYIGDELTFFCEVEGKERKTKWGLVNYLAWAENSEGTAVLKARAAIAHRYRD
ncbi:MaoC family dehydratase [Georgenia sp. 10Sc9-8]|uniref:MaoC family dehydratase n=1 Tax=Georgenia halotolerans TaxID=3028317 RepID=A0ABT5TYT5_9MICO|nr:MaoC family dehydratase [Georgenia halotolerans]